MIRRDVQHEEADQRAVKWCLVAAVFALCLGVLAEAAEIRRDVAHDPTPADTTAAVPTQIAT